VMDEGARMLTTIPGASRAWQRQGWGVAVYRRPAGAWEPHGARPSALMARRRIGPCESVCRMGTDCVCRLQSASSSLARVALRTSACTVAAARARPGREGGGSSHGQPPARAPARQTPPDSRRLPTDAARWTLDARRSPLDARRPQRALADGSESVGCRLAGRSQARCPP
jgi:hypothetical protein